MNREAGFTLVELLAAMVAGGLLLAIVGAMTGSIGTQLRRQDRDPRFEQVAAAAPMLTSMLADATPSSPNHDRFEGDERHLEAEVPPPAALGPVGDLRLALDVVRERDGAALALSLDQANPAFTSNPRLPLKRILAHGFKAIRLVYEQDERSSSGLPRLIRIIFETSRPDPWTIAIAPRLDTTGGCIFDPISLTCRQ